jgi:hypothetical protein
MEERGEELEAREGVASLDGPAEVEGISETVAPRESSEEPYAEGEANSLSSLVLETRGEKEDTGVGVEVRVGPIREVVGLPPALGETWEAMGAKEVKAGWVAPRGKGDPVRDVMAVVVNGLGVVVTLAEKGPVDTVEEGVVEREEVMAVHWEVVIVGELGPVSTQDPVG